MIIVTVLFILYTAALLINVFCDKIIRYYPFFKGFLLEGEVTGFDEVGLGKECYFLTIITYSKYDMTYKTFVHRSSKDKEGDKISIYTDGDISVRDKIYWEKKPTYTVLLYDLLGILISGIILIDNIQEVKWIFAGIGFLTVLLVLLVYPLLYSDSYRRIKNKLGYL